MSRTRTLIIAAVAAAAMGLSVIGGAAASQLAGPDVPECHPPDCYYA